MERATGKKIFRLNIRPDKSVTTAAVSSSDDEPVLQLSDENDDDEIDEQENDEVDYTKPTRDNAHICASKISLQKEEINLL